MTSADPSQHGGPLLVLANVAVARGKYDQAGQLFDESLEVHRRVGDIWELGVRLTAGAGLRLLLGDSVQARALAAEAMSIAEELDDPRGIAWSLEVFAARAAVAGHPEEGARLWGASDGLLERLGARLGPTVRWIRDRVSSRHEHRSATQPMRRVRRGRSASAVGATPMPLTPTMSRSRGC